MTPTLRLAAMLLALAGGIAFLTACAEEPAGDIVGGDTLPETPVAHQEAGEIITIDGVEYRRVSLIPELDETPDFGPTGETVEVDGLELELFELGGDARAFYTFDEEAGFWVRWLPAEETIPEQE